MSIIICTCNNTMNFIDICNENAGFIAFVQTLATLLISVIAVIVAVRAARMPYKKKLDFNTGLNYDQDGNYTLDVYLVNTGNQAILIKLIKVECREYVWFLEPEAADENRFVLPQKGFHGRLELTGLNANDESLKSENLEVIVVDSVEKEFRWKIGWAVG